ncbi:hypothetical protein B0H14DRAFT_3764867 [Mycena olivaceomarginata]|nr:hypothetical protein B0H14DRAFT_3764867 [Mycena olivaceomarginata]
MSYEAVARYQFRELDFNPRSEDDVEIVYQETMEARYIALKKPLETGLRFTLDLEVPPHNPDPGSRPLPFIPRTDPGTGVVLRLHEVLQPGVNAFSQVWTANVVDAETRLVMKIIQPSLLRLPSDWANEYYDPWDVAHNEAWAYQNLYNIIFAVNPSFIWSQIVAPCGELAWVLILEFIPRLTGNDVDESTPEADIHDFCALGVDAVRDFARSGWSLRDIRAPNFILTGAPGAWTVVIIDLFLVRPCGSLNLERVAEIAAGEFFFNFRPLACETSAPAFTTGLEKDLPRLVWSFREQSSSLGSEEDPSFESGSETKCWLAMRHHADMCPTCGLKD